MRSPTVEPQALGSPEGQPSARITRRGIWHEAGITGVENQEKVLEKLATSEKTTLVIARELDGKMRVTSGSWDGEKVFLKDQVLEVPQRRRLAACRRRERRSRDRLALVVPKLWLAGMCSP